MTFCALVAVVGFERVFTSADEDAGSFQLCVRIVTDASLLPISTEFFLDLLSVPASAGNNTHVLEFCHPMCPFLPSRCYRLC